MNADLLGVIANDKSRTTVYHAIVEAVVNSIQSINQSGRDDGQIVVNLIRSKQIPLDAGENALSNIESVWVEDNGIGFTKENRESFGMLFSRQKERFGGKGYGRIAFLKHFDSVSVESTYVEDGNKLERKFLFRPEIDNNDIDREVTPFTGNSLKTIIKLSNIKKENSLDKKVETVSRKILEMLLPYFVDTKCKVPKIIIKSDTAEEILNELVNNSDEITELDRGDFEIDECNNKKHKFTVVICKIFYAVQTNRISLVAHNREVVETNLGDYINEFSESFAENNKTYTIKAYVIGDYLDNNVRHQRTGFNFGKTTPTLECGITQSQIEKEASEIVKKSNKLVGELQTRIEATKTKVRSFVEENPWYKSYLKSFDYEKIPFNPSANDIEAALHKLQYDSECKVKEDVKKIEESKVQIKPEEIDKLVSSITDINKNQLARYVSHRKLVIDFLKKALEIKEDGKYSTESIVHNIIYPTNSDSDNCDWNEHNLWLLDERLTFTKYVTSDKRHIKESKDRSDILVFDERLVYRTGDDVGNPVTIFELKRPQRFDYLQPGSSEDPIEQILRYCQQIKNNNLVDNKGRTINVCDNTPFYGFIVSDINGDVEKWLNLKDFRIMPDGSGWYYWHSSLNLYVEFVSWDKVWKDAEMRNKIFFNKLGLS